jgi:hypothetical protein
MPSEQQIRQAFLRKYGLRIGPEMVRYVQEQLTGDESKTIPKIIPVMGADARTGVAIRQLLPQADLRAALNEVAQTY